MTWQARWSAEARADLLRLHVFSLERAKYAEDVALADRVLDAIETAVATQLMSMPKAHRMADDGADPMLRELLIPFGRGSYIARFRIVPPDLVLIIAIRHERESGYN